MSDDALDELNSSINAGFIYTGIQMDSTKKQIKSPENIRVIVDIRVKDHNTCHGLCPFLQYRSSTTMCTLFHRQLDRHFDDHIRHRLCKEALYVG